MHRDLERNVLAVAVASSVCDGQQIVAIDETNQLRDDFVLGEREDGHGQAPDRHERLIEVLTLNEHLLRVAIDEDFRDSRFEAPLRIVVVVVVVLSVSALLLVLAVLVLLSPSLRGVGRRNGH
jgi:hypothetical protein